MNDKNVHLLGIGGEGMSALAYVLLAHGYTVSGSDIRENAHTHGLRESGAFVFLGHSRHNVRHATAVIYSSAVSLSNPELQEARRKNIPVLRRAEMLSKLMEEKTAVTISGTHGKTTTSWLAARILLSGGLDPTAVIGGRCADSAANFLVGDGRHFVVEADESDGSLLHFRPHFSIITNIEEEHLDYLEDIKAALDLFEKFAAQTHPEGAICYNADDPNLADVVKSFPGEKIGFSLNGRGDIVAEKIELENFTSSFEVSYRDLRLGPIDLAIPGRHNVANALGPIALGVDLGIDPERIKEALARFGGVGRRFELLGEPGDVMVIDDYAHHPTEVSASIASARKLENRRKIVGVFQPHRYSRTKRMAGKFARAFREVDQLILTDVYAASEDPIDGVDGKMIFDNVVAAGQKNVHYLKDINDIPSFIAETAAPGDVILNMGAGNISEVARKTLEKLNSISSEPATDD